MKRRLLILILVPVVLVATGYLYEKWAWARYVSLHEQLSAALAEELPPGSTVDQAEAFMQKWQLTSEGSLTTGMVGEEDLEEESEQTKAAIKYSMRGLRRDYYDMLIVRFTLYATMYFDKDKRLILSTVGQWGDGF